MEYNTNYDFYTLTQKFNYNDNSSDGYDNCYYNNMREILFGIVNPLANNSNKTIIEFIRYNQGMPINDLHIATNFYKRYKLYFCNT